MLAHTHTYIHSDVVALYKGMNEMGLNYGPSFQSIETLHSGVPEGY